MTVRAKFRCTAKNQTETGYTLTFEPVTYGSPENDSFYKWTPWGKLEMGTINDEAAKGFVPGQSYYLDFIPVG